MEKMDSFTICIREEISYPFSTGSLGFPRDMAGRKFFCSLEEACDAAVAVSHFMGRKVVVFGMQRGCTVGPLKVFNP